MRIAILTVLYEDMLDRFYKKRPEIQHLQFERHRAEFDRAVSLWAGGWSRAFTRKGWESTTITVNNRSLQHHWARECQFTDPSLESIALEQLRRFKPDVLWFDYFDSVLLKRIRNNVPSVKLVLGWTGSALVDEMVLRGTDLVLSCAPEAVSRLRASGVKSEHLHHAFDAELLSDLGPRRPTTDMSFVGQIFRGADLHGTREALLLQLVDKLPLTIYSPSFALGPKDILRYSLKKLAYYFLWPFLLSDRIDLFAQRNNYLKEIRRSGRSSWLPYDTKLRRSISAPVYGIAMVRSLRQSKVVLNIHADSSPIFASNMRLFETTGAGACLLTDWKENLHSLFEDGSEVLSYRNASECIEKATWLLENPKEREAIAAAGQRRTLKDHTFDSRIEELLSLISKNL